MTWGWKRKYNKKFKQKVIEYVLQGHSQSEAGRKFNTSSKNVQRWLSNHKRTIDNSFTDIDSMIECGKLPVKRYRQVLESSYLSDDDRKLLDSSTPGYNKDDNRINKELESLLEQKQAELNRERELYDTYLKKYEEEIETFEKENFSLKDENIKLKKYIIDQIVSKNS